MKKKLVYYIIPLLWSLNARSQEQVWIYTTRPGDTLWKISKSYLTSVNYWEKIQKYNAIINPRLLAPGFRLRIPMRWLKQQPSTAIVIAVSGRAEVKIFDQDKYITLKVGMKLHARSEVKTSDGSSVVLKFADNSQLIIQQNSTLDLKTLTMHGKNGMVDTQLGLQNGRVESRVVPFIHQGSRYEIITPAAVASVRGTQFRVRVNPNSTMMYSEVIVGKVAVSSEGVTQLVSAGFGTSVTMGMTPLLPQKLLAAPLLSQLDPVFYTQKISFSWGKLDDISTYHVEIALSNKFFNVLLDDNINTPRINWDAPGTGEFFLRVAELNKLGNEGLGAVHEFSILAELPVPQLMSPQNNSMVPQNKLIFQWRGESDIQRFHLQVSSRKNFDTLKIEVSGDQQHYTMPERLTPGLYYWRVSNEYKDGFIGKYSEIFQFTLFGVPK